VSSKGDRSKFLRLLMREAVDFVGDARSVLRAQPEVGQDRLDEAEPWEEPRTVRGEPARRRVLPAELLELCDEVGFGGLTAEVERLARTGLRLTRSEGGSGASWSSRLGGLPNLPADFDWPTRHGEELAFLAQIDLGRTQAFDLDGLLPTSGSLLVFYDVANQPSGRAARDEGACRVVHVKDAEELRPDPDGRSWFAEYPLELSHELVVPRSWSMQVGLLGLSGSELSAWDELRELVAERQGVRPEELSPDFQALHRLLGYPDDLGEEMELTCELVTAGVDDLDPDDAERDGARAGAGQWRLLIQISDDDELGTAWGEGFGRLYVWIREQDLRSHTFDRVWAIVN
jgi:uncharacterized protein YwqG